MPDLARGGVDNETPVNPYSLLEAVNHSSESANRAWLIFLALMTYLMVAVAGVSHRDLLLETPVKLPGIDVPIQLTQFFQFAPVILVLLHLGLVSQLALLARKTLEFDHTVRMMEANDRRTHPLRLELHNFFFVQAIAGPERSSVMSGILHTMSWLTLVVLPVVLILYIQAVFLPYHDISTTWGHRLALVCDIALLVLIGVFLMRAETSFVQAFSRTTTAHPWSFGMTVVVLALVTFVSFFAATVPGEAMDQASRIFFGAREDDEPGARRRYAGGFTLPFLGSGSSGALFGIFTRNLVVTDTDLVADKDVTEGEATLNLRHRDLRHARLDRSDLHQADLTGANISHASFVGADLRHIQMSCADVNELLLSDDRKLAGCASAREADLSRARLERARLMGVDLRGARLEEARLIEAELTYALLTGANFSSANLQKADLTGGVQAQGANFLIASLQGADLTGAQLHYADFTSAGLQGAGLNYANMQAAVLRDSDLEGANVQQAKLFGADMTGAKLAGVDMRFAEVWATNPPPAGALSLADLSNLQLRPPSEAERGEMSKTVTRIRNDRTRRLVSEAMATVMDPATAETWKSSEDLGQWRKLVSAAEAEATAADFSDRLTAMLVQAMCRPRWAQGAMATGVARRAQSNLFRGAMVSIYQRLNGDAACPAGKAVPARIMRELTAAVDLQRDAK